MIPVVLSTDENYWIPACVTIASMLANAYESTSYDIYIIYSGDVVSKMEKVLAQIYARVSGEHLVHFVLASDLHVAEVNYIPGYQTEAAFYRLYIADFLKEYKKCLYIDVDVVVQKDLAELFGRELDGAYIAGVRDQCVQETMQGINPMKSMGIENITGYINSGVLLFDLGKIREENLVARFVSAIDMRLAYDDQGILNYCCYGKIKYLPVKYNFFQRFYGNSGGLSKEIYPREELEGAEEPYVIHFAGPMKPWNHIRIAGGVEWWKYLDYFMENGEKEQYREYVEEKNPYESWMRILDVCKADNDVVIFGCGKFGKQLIEELYSNNVTSITHLN